LLEVVEGLSLALGDVVHLLNFKELDGERLSGLVEKGVEVKRNPEGFSTALGGRSCALIFQKTSTRTRVSFEVAMTQLGGHGLFVDWRTTNFGLADLGDEVRYLSRNVDCILARLLRNADLRVMAEASRVPVVNGCDEKYHPSQAVADLITVRERMGRLKGVRLVYVGVHNNVCNSLIEGCTKTGVRITTVTPVFNEASQDDELLAAARRTGLWESSLDVKGAVADADFVYTDTWVDMEFFADPKFAVEKEKRLRVMMPFQVNRELLEGSGAFVMHDMPIHRGYEIAADVIDGERSVIFEQSENRLYSAKAILLKLLVDG
jgi:ornithine carbamoyltransferase